jgi:hypothetical protein
MKKYLILLVLFTSACNTAEQSVDAVDESNINLESDYNTTLKANNAQESTSVQVPMLLKTANIVIEVNDFEQQTKAFKEILAGANGYLAAESLTNKDYEVATRFTVMLPSGNFDAFTANVKELAYRVIQFETSSVDVSEEFTDINTRIKSKKIVLERYISFLAKAKTMEETLQAEEAVRKLTEEIEAAQGRVNYLSQHSKYSRVECTIVEPLNQGQGLVKSPNFFSKLWNSVKTGFTGLENLIIAVVMVWPLWMVIAIVVYVVRRFWLKKN